MNSNPATRRSPTSPDTSPGSRVGPWLHVLGDITCLVIIVLMKASSASLLRPMPDYWRGEKSQAGFRPGHGTLDQLYTLYRVRFGRRLPAVNAVREERRSSQTSKDSRHLTLGNHPKHA
ncbi:hypothetical protein ATANTOWER_018895 [Ataeniobius toweri]|uniref:Uncharacterized protein n=1 Tax=Ataeniobius toweri TaxID=208326 RepID=A0ABU7BN24_9TELE|nr:hypothetical protein [Ataeniobius toweri]